jgi:hypothetical protein
MLPEKFQQLTTTAEVTSFCSMNDVMRDNVICGRGISGAVITVPGPEGDVITIVPQSLHVIIKHSSTSQM